MTSRRETTIHGADSSESVEVTSRSMGETMELSLDPSPLLEIEGETDDDDDAYMSSSSEDEKTSKSSKQMGQQESEWDKALQTGRPSEGKAAADLFPAPSTDAEDLPAHAAAATTTTNAATANRNLSRPSANSSVSYPHPDDSDIASGVLPDVLMNMRQTIESSFMGLDSDMMRLADDNVADHKGRSSSIHGSQTDDDDDPLMRESRESLKRSSQQSISAAVLVSLAHKRYERRRLAAMEIEKVVRSLVQQNEMERIRAILLLLSDDYVRSANEDARKGGVVALAACTIGLKKANDKDPMVMECRDLILASVVHGCQCHSQRVRYYATESLFNVVKVMPSMAVQHFFILFEILRSLYADVDVDVRSGAELLDKKLKEVIVNAMNNNTPGFTAEDCIPVFARFVHMRNKATKRLTLTWLQELNEKLHASPILEFLHLFLGGIFDMVGDPSLAIRQSALAFLHSVLPKLLVVVDASGSSITATASTEGYDTKRPSVDFDKVLQSLVTTMEHPDPSVRKIAVYWMSRIVKAHLVDAPKTGTKETTQTLTSTTDTPLSLAAISIRDALPHILPGIFLSIGDSFHPQPGATKDFFLPDQSTRLLAEQTNQTLQDAVRRNGPSHVQHLDGFIVALREELDDGLVVRHPPAVERLPYRIDVIPDGTGIESPGWFRASRNSKDRNSDSMIMSRLCALQWIIVLYESVVPVSLKAEYAREFVFTIINQLVDNPSETIVHKSLEVLAKITVPVPGEDMNVSRSNSTPSLCNLASDPALASGDVPSEFPMTESSISYAFNMVEEPRQLFFSRNREVFSAIVQLHATNENLLVDLSNVITYMCKMQPPEFVYVSFSVEIDRFMLQAMSGPPFAKRLKFVSSFIQHMSHVLLNTAETKPLRDILQDCVCSSVTTERDRQRSRLFRILLHTFSHNLSSAVSLCFWAGAYRTIQLFLNQVNPLDMNLMFFLEMDRFVEMLERPLFRHVYVRMLERDDDPTCEGSGSMLFQALKSLVMILPQSTCYFVLKDRLTSVARFRQSAVGDKPSRSKGKQSPRDDANSFLTRVIHVRALHCKAAWETIRADSLEVPVLLVEKVEDGVSRREWLGYSSLKADREAQENYRQQKLRRRDAAVEEITEGLDDLADKMEGNAQEFIESAEPDESSTAWRDYWQQGQVEQ